MTTLNTTRFAAYPNQAQFGKLKLPKFSISQQYVNFGPYKWEKADFQVMTFNHMVESFVSSTLRRPLNYLHQLNLKSKQIPMSPAEALNHEFTLWKCLFERKT